VALDDARRFVSPTHAFAVAGPALEPPHLVLDVAVPARADALVVWSVRDFTHPSDIIVNAGRIHVGETAVHPLVTVHPPGIACGLRTGEPPPSG